MALAVTSKIAERLGAWRTSARGSEPIYAPFDEGEHRDALPCDDDDENRLDHARDDDCRPELSLPWAQVWRRWNRRELSLPRATSADADDHHPFLRPRSAFAPCGAARTTAWCTRARPGGAGARSTRIARRDDRLARTGKTSRPRGDGTRAHEISGRGGNVGHGGRAAARARGSSEADGGSGRRMSRAGRRSVTRGETTGADGPTRGRPTRKSRGWWRRRGKKTRRGGNRTREGPRAGAELGMTEEEEAEARCALMTHADFRSRISPGVPGRRRVRAHERRGGGGGVCARGNRCRRGRGGCSRREEEGKGGR